MRGKRVSAPLHRCADAGKGVLKAELKLRAPAGWKGGFQTVDDAGYGHHEGMEINMNKKRILSLIVIMILAACLAVCLAACGETDDKDADKEKAKVQTEQKEDSADADTSAQTQQGQNDQASGTEQKPDSSAASGEEEEPDVEVADQTSNPIEQYVGTYQDQVSQRAQMIIDKGDEGTGVLVTIIWGGSAFETAQWEISGEIEESTNTISYNRCIKSIISEGEDGEQKVDVQYEEGSGQIVIGNGYITWQDNVENAGADCQFVPVQ